MMNFAARTRPRFRERHAYGDVSEFIHNPTYRVVMTDPLGVEFDVTDRCEGIGEITYSTEEEILDLTHGDVTLNLDNLDGAVEQYLRAASPSDVYELVIERTTGGRRGKWQRIFGGILDLPWSVQYDRKMGTVDVQVFSFSKLMERASAESVKRNITGRTLTSVTSTGSSVVNMSSTTDIEPGDEIEVTDDTTVETQIVRRVTSGTVLEIVAAGWDHVFAVGSPVEVLTPYLRDKGVDYLAEQLFAAAGINARGFDVDRPIATFPFPTPLARKGLSIDASGNYESFRVLSVKGGKIAGWGTTNRKSIANPRSTWVDDGADATKLDWTIHQDTEPATLLDGFGTDVTSVAANYAAGDVWRWGQNGGTNNMELYKNAVVQVVGDNTGTAAQWHSCEWVPEDGKPWVSQMVATAGLLKTLYWDGAVLQTLEASIAGRLRYLRVVKQVALHEWQRSGLTLIPTTSLRIYDATSRAHLFTITVPKDFQAQTLRVVGGHIVAMYGQGPTTRVRVWDLAWIQIADYEVSATKPTPTSQGLRTMSLSVWRPIPGSNAIEYGVINVGSLFFVLATSYAGVVPYADMNAKSVAAGMRQLAIITLTYVEVDELKFGTLTSRAIEADQSRRQTVDVGVPVSRRSWLLWEQYRTSVLVSGTDQAGNKLEVTAGDTGASARRLEISGDFITSGGLADAIGRAYVSFFSRLRTQDELDVVESGNIVMPLMYISMDGHSYLVQKASAAIAEKRTQRLTVVEAA